MAIYTKPGYVFGTVPGKERELQAGQEVDISEYDPGEPGVIGWLLRAVVIDANTLDLRHAEISRPPTGHVVRDFTLNVAERYTKEEINSLHIVTEADCATRKWSIYWRE